MGDRMSEHTRNAIASWRRLPESEKHRIRKSVVRARVIASMAMENEPVSDAWASASND